MKVKQNLLFALALLASPTFAADTVCSIVTGLGTENVLPIDATNGPNIGTTIPIPNVTFAVASNFYYPAIELAGQFLTSTVGGNYTAIGVCHNATGHLVSEITGSNPPVITGEWLSVAIGYKYGLFAAANAAAPVSLVPQYTFVDYPPMTYANGIPAFLAGATFNGGWTGTGGLLTENTSSPVNGIFHANNGTGPATAVRMNNASTILTEIGIGDIVSAPYGLAAKNVITDMEQWPGDANVVAMTGNTPGPCTATAVSPSPAGICMYDNIDITYDQTAKVTTSGLNAGWVSWAQIVSDGNGGGNIKPYVTFPDYSFPQKAVLLTNPYPAITAVGAALAFWNFIDLEAPNSTNNVFYQTTDYTWNGWLAQNGYGPIVASFKSSKQQSNKQRPGKQQKRSTPKK
jgi:hypothetical protein